MSARTWRATVALVGLVAAVSFLLSASALADVATWAGVHGRLTWAVPVMVDAGALAFTLAGLAQRSRGERVRLAWSCLGVLALVSVVANVTHGLADVVAADVRLAVGVATVGVAPLVVLVAVHVLAGLVAPVATHVAAPVVAREAPEVVEPVRAPQAGATASRPWSDVPLWDDAASTAPIAPGEGDEVAAMRALRERGLSLREVGARYGVHASTVSRRLAAAGAVPA